jgi:hypothetical protein
VGLVHETALLDGAQVALSEILVSALHDSLGHWPIAYHGRWIWSLQKRRMLIAVEDP